MLDLRGLRCPLPVLKTAKAVKAAAPGALFEVWTDDPGATHDFPDFCAAQGCEIIAIEEDTPGVWRVFLRKG